jgi:hypothetical protein
MAMAFVISPTARAGSDGVESFYFIPVEAGIQGKPHVACPWMPSSAGMTLFGSTRPESALIVSHSTISRLSNERLIGRAKIHLMT